MQSTTSVVHPQLGPGRLLKTYMGGFEWEVLFESGRRYRLPAREFATESVTAWQAQAAPAAPIFAPRVTLPETDQFRARQTLEALRLGIVPVQDVETLTIGLEAERVSLERALVRSKERGGDVQSVIGDYGFGKSHFVELAARYGLRENFIVAVASLDLVEVPPSKANEIYRALVRSIRYPDVDERGLGPLLKQAIDTPGVVEQFAARAPRADCPLSAALKALADCHSQGAYDDIVQWISGQIKPTAELKTCLKKPPRLYIAGSIARQYAYLLTAISVLATMVGYSGLAVLIDESEHYSLLRANQRDRADAFFKAMIYGALGAANSRVDPLTIPEHPRVDYELTFATNPHLFFLFALTESENRMPVDVWLAPSQIVRLDDRFIERDIREFFQTLLRYHSIAYGYEFPPPRERYEEIVQAVPGLLSRALSQHRINLREVIRLAVITYDLLYLHPDYTADALLEELRRGLRL
ncbi:MAG TPA: BREX system ATP-binding domain-containing protein [Herpetosiphonaceae bacterium]|nr:BREX system ATP-binding domain-containing protein [Herpetosiphonaceae bacterium]